MTTTLPNLGTTLNQGTSIFTCLPWVGHCPGLLFLPFGFTLTVAVFRVDCIHIKLEHTKDLETLNHFSKAHKETEGEPGLTTVCLTTNIMTFNLFGS